MATRSLIGYYNKEDNTVHFCYNHWDGYTTGVGKTLFLKANTLESVIPIIDDKSAINFENKELISIAPEYYATDKYSIIQDLKEKHKEEIEEELLFMSDIEDMAEDLLTVETCSLEEFGNKYSEEYCYLFKDNQWYISNYSDFTLLKEEHVLNEDCFLSLFKNFENNSYNLVYMSSSDLPFFDYFNSKDENRELISVYNIGPWTPSMFNKIDVIKKDFNFLKYSLRNKEFNDSALLQLTEKSIKSNFQTAHCITDKVLSSKPSLEEQLADCKVEKVNKKHNVIKEKSL